jgi:hypothetical protein
MFHVGGFSSSMLIKDHTFPCLEENYCHIRWWRVEKERETMRGFVKNREVVKGIFGILFLISIPRRIVVANQRVSSLICFWSFLNN